jgi:succinate dehydrogenase / fumarate reductase cytochrome b subunit
VVNASLHRSRPLTGLLSLWHSSIGKKFVMAITGFILFGYVVLHLWGNLRLFYGPEALNQWGVFLRVVGDPIFRSQQLLWIVRVVLLAALVLHVTAAYQLSRQDYAGRPIRYAIRKNLESTLASRTMRWGGIFVLLFIVYHILDLTTGTLHPGRFEEGNIYANVVGSFRVWYVSLIYIAAVIALGMHLNHGIWSIYQTLGMKSSRSDRFWRNTGIGIAVVLTLGNVAIPLSVLTGVVR